MYYYFGIYLSLNMDQKYTLEEAIKILGLKQYKVHLTEGIIRALIKFRMAVNYHKKNKIHLLKDMKTYEFELTPHEWNNFSRLRFHGLVAKYKEEGKHVAGYWLLTRRGADFLNGEISIPATVTIFQNKVVYRSERVITVKDVIKDDSVPYFEKINDIEYEDVPVEDVPAVREKMRKAKKGKRTCPKCKTQLKVMISSAPGDTENSVKVTTILKCPNLLCGYEELLLPEK